VKEPKQDSVPKDKKKQGLQQQQTFSVDTLFAIRAYTTVEEGATYN
jgi:hypothetical protein